MKLIGKTDIGKVRDINEDSYAVGNLDDHLGFLLICDGMGGQCGGNIASQLARDTMVSILSNDLKPDLSAMDIKSKMIESIERANAVVYEKAMQDRKLKGMGTTVVLAVIQNDTVHIAHVGDSRAYLLSQNILTQITKDHSFVEMLIDEGEITRSQAQDHPRKNQITRAVGVLQEVEVDYSSHVLLPNDRLMICSDGLSNFCSQQEMTDALTMDSLQDAALALIDQANLHGGEDNITVALAESL